MWYPLLILLIAAACLRWCGKEKTAWEGSPRTSINDRPFIWVHEVNSKQKPIASRIGISAPNAFAFHLHQEGFAHRFTKWAGFCNEFQTENPGFDTRTYIFSDHPQFLQKLQISHDTQRNVLEAFNRGVTEFRVNGTHVFARLKKPVANPPMDDVDAVLDALHALKNLCYGIPAQPNAQARYWAMQAFHALPIFLLASALTTLVFCLLFGFTLVQWEPWLMMSAKLAALFLLSGIATLWLLLRRTAYGHTALMRFSLFSSWSAALCILSVLWFTNCLYDRADGQTHILPVQEKYITHGRRTKGYHIRVADWTGDYMTMSLKIGQNLYNTLSLGQKVSVHIRPGWLGMEWIAKVEKAQ
ncbi:MAG: hypothetical protein K2Q01_09805 [Rickettsiales bacterium]|nr:hypothetical protein [Rickettsiales bacterium]